MIYQQDWLMRQIEAMIQAILAVALGISANEQTATQIEDSSYGKMLEKMIDDGDICAAEDLLFNDLDQSDLSWLQIFFFFRIPRGIGIILIIAISGNICFT